MTEKRQASLLDGLFRFFLTFFAVMGVVVFGIAVYIGIDMSSHTSSSTPGQVSPTPNAIETCDDASITSDAKWALHETMLNNVIGNEGSISDADVNDIGKFRELNYDQKENTRNCAGIADTGGGTINFRYTIYPGPSGKTLVKAWPGTASAPGIF